MTDEAQSPPLQDIGGRNEFHRPGQFARFRIGSGSLHLVPLGKVGFHLEFDIEDINGAHKQLAAAGLNPGKPQHHPWGKTDFRLLDPDGNVLEFGAVDPRA